MKVIIEIRSHNFIGLHIIITMFEKLYKLLYKHHSVKKIKALKVIREVRKV